MSRPPKTFAYCRASPRPKKIDPTTHEEARVMSIDTQKGIVKEFCQGRGIPMPDEWYCDPAVSGKSILHERKGGRALCAALQPGDTLILPKMDRAFRRLADAAPQFEVWARLGIKLYICDMGTLPLDFTSPLGMFLVHILAAFAELERKMISTRTKEGLAERKAKGLRHSHYAGYGMKWVKAWVTDPETGCKEYRDIKVQDDREREHMRRIVEMRHNDPPFGWDQIVTSLKSIKATTLHGKEWDRNRVKRAYLAELELQRKEPVAQ